jgi:hypothetical protein
MHKACVDAWYHLTASDPSLAESYQAKVGLMKWKAMEVEAAKMYRPDFSVKVPASPAISASVQGGEDVAV